MGFHIVLNNEIISHPHTQFSCTAAEVITEEMKNLQLAADARACTGALASHPSSRDLKVINFTLTFHGAELFLDTQIELNCGRRYGLIGLNGSGKF